MGAIWVDRRGFLTLVILLLLLSACGLLPVNGPYHETFDEAGQWGVGDDLNVEGQVENGVYDFLVKRDTGLFWATAPVTRGDGIYEVEATQVEGPLDNGYGMLFRFDPEDDDFYIFEVSGDGYVWIGRCAGGCSEASLPLVGDGWIESAAVKQGLDQTNVLRVRAEGANLIFFVNGEEVGRVTDNTLDEGDVGMMVETLGQGGVRVRFDNFKVLPLEE